MAGRWAAFCPPEQTASVENKKRPGRHFLGCLPGFTVLGIDCFANPS